jgi:multidrug efflux pump subunit AcrA (membrane-fusion protein)
MIAGTVRKMLNQEAEAESYGMTPEGAQAAMGTQGPTGRRKRLAILATVVIAAILIFSVIVVWQARKSSQPQQAKTTTDKATQTPTIPVSRVVSKDVDRQLKLPGELRAYQDVAIYAKVQGFVETISVDRGSVVRRGQVLIRMSAPELLSRTAEAQARVGATKDQRLEMEAGVRSVREQKAEAAAKLAADEGTYRRLKAASATPGVVAENDVDIARQGVEADRAHIRLLEENEKAAQAVVQSQSENEKAALSSAKSVRDVESYLNIWAPFAGIITERNVDKGSLAGPSSGGSVAPMLRLQQISRLRLVIAVPETDVAGITRGDPNNLRRARLSRRDLPRRGGAHQSYVR